MTRPQDAATEALAEAKAFVRRALKGKRSEEHVRRLAELVLKRRGYVIRKARRGRADERHLPPGDAAGAG